MDMDAWLPAVTGLVGVAVGGGVQLWANKLNNESADRRAERAAVETRQDALAKERASIYSDLLTAIHAVHDRSNKRLLDNADIGNGWTPDLDGLDLYRAQVSETESVVSSLRRASLNATSAVLLEAERCVEYFHAAVEADSQGAVEVAGWTEGRTPVDVLERLVAFELRAWRETPRLSESEIGARVFDERKRLLKEVDNEFSFDFK